MLLQQQWIGSNWMCSNLVQRKLAFHFLSFLNQNFARLFHCVIFLSWVSPSMLQQPKLNKILPWRQRTSKSFFHIQLTLQLKHVFQRLGNCMAQLSPITPHWIFSRREWFQINQHNVMQLIVLSLLKGGFAEFLSDSNPMKHRRLLQFANCASQTHPWPSEKKKTWLANLTLSCVSLNMQDKWFLNGLKNGCHTQCSILFMCVVVLAEESLHLLKQNCVQLCLSTQLSLASKKCVE